MYRHLLHTDSAGPPQTIAAQLASVRDRHLGAVVTGVEPAAGGSETTRVYLADDRVGERERRTVFVDPQTTEVLGDSVTYGSAGALPLRTWIGGLHRNLHLGEPGRVYSETAASWLWVVALGGLTLWINRFRTKRRNTGAPWWRIGVIDRRGIAQPHAEPARRGGRVARRGPGVPPATGLTWSHYAGDNIAKLRTELSWQRPDLPTSLPTGSHHGTHGTAAPQPAFRRWPTINSTRCWESHAATAWTAGWRSPFPPTRAARSRSQTRQPWRYSVDSLAIDPHTMQVSAELPFSSWSIPAKLTDWAIQLHMGILFGWASALALLTGRAAGRRDRSRLPDVVATRNREPPGRAPARGTWRTAARSASPCVSGRFRDADGRNHCRRLVRPAVGDPAARVPDPRRGDRPTVAHRSAPQPRPIPTTATGATVVGRIRGRCDTRLFVGCQ